MSCHSLGWVAAFVMMIASAGGSWGGDGVGGLSYISQNHTAILYCEQFQQIWLGSEIYRMRHNLPSPMLIVNLALACGIAISCSNALELIQGPFTHASLIYHQVRIIYPPQVRGP